MKKSLSILSTALIFAVISCGPSAEEKAKRDKEHADSLAAEEAMKMELEAEKAAAVQDSIANAEKMKADSLAADSAAKAAAKPAKK